MSQLAKIDNLSPDLSDLESQIIANSRGIKVLKSKKIEVAKLAVDIIDTSLIVLGFSKKTYSSEERNLIENEIINDILTKFKHLTCKEIKEAVKLGARGEFKTKPDEVIIFSVSTVYSWIKSYSDTIRREALKKQARFEQDSLKPKEPTRIMLLVRADIFREACILAPYRHYLATDEYLFDNRGNVIYNKLDKLGLIPFPPSVKKVFMEQAKELVLASLIAYPSNENQKTYNEVKEDKGNGHKLVISQAKDLALRAFFKDLKDVNADLEKLLKE